MENKTITIIDETIREGMQYRGLVFSQDQRKKILDFQEALNIDICQAGYPPAHSSEALAVQGLHQYAHENRYRISVAGMGRINARDIQTLIDTGINAFHFHAQIKNDADPETQNTQLFSIQESLARLSRQVPDSRISIAMLDLGKTDPHLLKHFTGFLADTVKVDLLSLPDTSGIMTPQGVFKTISSLMPLVSDTKTRISIHCHNDMGMASANTVTGIMAGGRAVEVSVLGIGERNGIADLFTTVAMLKSNGFQTRMKTDDTDTFQAYYNYINAIIVDQTGEGLLNYATPFFGTGVKTHVAGTHAGGVFGAVPGDNIRLNLLCGQQMVKNFLISNNIPFDDNQVAAITRAVKSESARMNRSLNPEDMLQIISLIS